MDLPNTPPVGKPKVTTKKEFKGIAYILILSFGIPFVAVGGYALGSYLFM